MEKLGFKVGDRVVEVGTGINGVVGDIDMNNPYSKVIGVWFEDDSDSIFWVEKNLLTLRQ